MSNPVNTWIPSTTVPTSADASTSSIPWLTGQILMQIPGTNPPVPLDPSVFDNADQATLDSFTNGVEAWYRPEPTLIDFDTQYPVFADFDNISGDHHGAFACPFIYSTNFSTGNEFPHWLADPAYMANHLAGQDWFTPLPRYVAPPVFNHLVKRYQIIETIGGVESVLVNYDYPNRTQAQNYVDYSANGRDLRVAY